MDAAFETDYHQHEETNWWCRSRRDLILRLLGRFPKTSRILDIGCSSGVLLDLLRKEGFARVEGCDRSERAVAACRARGIAAATVGDGARLEFADAYFDVVVASDVLEHCDDESAAIQEWRRVLRPGGTLMVFVPAFPFLWGPHDENNHHLRRYSARALRGVVEECQLSIARSSHWNLSLFVPAALDAALRRVLPASVWKTRDRPFRLRRWLNAFLYGLLSLENRLVSCVDLPFGVSLFVTSRKPVEGQGVNSKQ
jgi:SAM-dependent methyltransferase